MRILLVRHGESLGNVDPAVHATTADHAVPLSDRGREQAREAGRRLAAYLEQRADGEHRHVRLWVSPYLRTRQTADALQETAGPWITDRVEHVLLCEQQFGLFDGIPEEELPERFPREFAHYDMQCRFGGKFWARMPMGESRFDVAQRIHQAFGTFQRDAVGHGIRDLVVICHGVTLRAFVMMWCHLSPEWFEHEPNPQNAAIRLLERSEDRGYVFEGFPRR
jgi:2,3-bisphosphoglycerate-dependent phosphoglycerate mutase